MPTSEPSPTPDRAGAWTIPLLCAGIALIACCLIIPAADENRRLAYEREKLRLDLEQIQKQEAVYKKFLDGISRSDPNVLQRLAQGQMKLVREGTRVLDLPGQNGSEQFTPYLLVTLPPPSALVPYKPVGGVFSELCRQPRPQLIMLGAGLLLVAVGMVLGTDASR